MGANFTSKTTRKLCEIDGMKKTQSTQYHPMGNGMVERFNKTLLNMLETRQDHQKSDWKSHVPTLTHAYNAAVYDSTWCQRPTKWLVSSVGRVLGKREAMGSSPGRATIFSSPVTFGGSVWVCC